MKIYKHMDKYYINKENASTLIRDLIAKGVIQSEYQEVVREKVKELPIGQYLVVEHMRGSGIIISAVDPARVPLDERLKAGEKVDPAYYL